MSPAPGLLEIALLAAVALCAGVVDAIAGGGGLLTLPALLAAGLPPHLAIATNKGQSTFGAFSALTAFWRAGMIDRRRAKVGFPLAVAGSLAGASLLLLVRPDVLRPVVLALLVAVALFVAVRRGGPPRADLLVPERWVLPVAGAWSFLLGGYDGFFGPGTGTFLIVGFVALLGDTLAGASAAAKVVNFASNLAALVLLAARGVVVWRVALPMAAAQLVGGHLGAHLTVRKGDVLVRRVVLVVVLALCVKLARDLLA